MIVIKLIANKHDAKVQRRLDKIEIKCLIRTCIIIAIFEKKCELRSLNKSWTSMINRQTKLLVLHFFATRVTLKQKNQFLWHKKSHLCMTLVEYNIFHRVHVHIIWPKTKEPSILSMKRRRWLNICKITMYSSNAVCFHYFDLLQQ